MRHFSTILIVGISTGISSLVFGCAADAVSPDAGSVADNEQAAGPTPYFQIRRDYRKCPSPGCAGWFVKKINTTATRCVNGSFASECYVEEIDFSGAGFDRGLIGDNGMPVLRGKIKPKKYGTKVYGRFVVSDVWTAANADAPAGTFYSVHDNGVRCVKAPCFGMDADKVNQSSTIKISSLGGDMAGKAGEIVTGGQTIIIAGTIGPAASEGKELGVTQFYRKHEPAQCVTDADCRATPFGKPIASLDDCYCPMCPTYATSNAEAQANTAAWGQHCIGLVCPVAGCMNPQPVACVANKCQFKPLAGAGERCGGFENVRCADGLQCVDAGGLPARTGTCKPVDTGHDQCQSDADCAPGCCASPCAVPDCTRPRECHPVGPNGYCLLPP